MQCSNEKIDRRDEERGFGEVLGKYWKTQAERFFSHQSDFLSIGVVRATRPLETTAEQTQTNRKEKKKTKKSRGMK